MTKIRGVGSIYIDTGSFEEMPASLLNCKIATSGSPDVVSWAVFIVRKLPRQLLVPTLCRDGLPGGGEHFCELRRTKSIRAAGQPSVLLKLQFLCERFGERKRVD